MTKNGTKLKSKSIPRPPVVCVLGHVNHGKTTLLDCIRQTNIVISEAGGITQHTGAYQVKIKTKDKKKKLITFLDTPGHEAFAKMRSRGAEVADLAVLVIASDDGVKPQTKEAISFIKAAKIPFLVAINKIDLPSASPEMVKSQLAKEDVLVEGYGGDVVCVEVSAKEKRGIDELLEMILLITEMQNLQASEKVPLEAVVIESKLDRFRGPLATVLVKNGTLVIGDKLAVENIEGKVKAMFDENGKRVRKAGASEPVEVLGFKKVPPVGGKVGRIGQGITEGAEEHRRRRISMPSEASVPSVIPEGIRETPKLKIILKADTLGTLEAIEANLPKEELKIIHKGASEVTESDVLLASSTDGVILTFNVKTPLQAKKLAEQEKVLIKNYKVIYELLKDIEEKVLKILEPTIDEEVLGEAEVIAEFKIRGNHIAGCQVKKGEFKKQNKIHLKRKDKIMADSKIVSLQIERQDADKAKKGAKIGLVFSPDIDFQIGDDIIAYSVKSKE